MSIKGKPKRIRVKLDAETQALLRRTIRGNGGFQGLQKKLQAALGEDGHLDLDLETARQVAQYADSYGQGGYQSRIKPLAQKVKDLLPPGDSGQQSLLE